MSEEIAWAAGLYEGEGTVFAPWSKRDCRYHSPKLQINMTDEDIIDRFGAIIQVGHKYGPYPGVNKPKWYWTVYVANETKNVLDSFWPYLGARRKEQAKEAFHLWMASHPNEKILWGVD